MHRVLKITGSWPVWAYNGVWASVGYRSRTPGQWIRRVMPHEAENLSASGHPLEAQICLIFCLCTNWLSKSLLVSKLVCSLWFIMHWVTAQSDCKVAVTVTSSYPWHVDIWWSQHSSGFHVRWQLCVIAAHYARLIGPWWTNTTHIGIVWTARQWR